ncbi:hypothetical protein [Mesonia sp.]|uniref:hypothetical protein n=1 Tax=Mesonia sp. TaxID=1960830 RepID=UPI003F97C34F
MKYKLCYLFFLLFFVKINAQEDIYIFFEKGKGDFVKEENDLKRFYLKPSIDASYFVHNENAQKPVEVCFETYKDKMISKREANELVMGKLESKAQKFEEETGLKGNIYRNPPYDYNALFKSVYIYFKIDSLKGTLYEVHWNYAIE